VIKTLKNFFVIVPQYFIKKFFLLQIFFIFTALIETLAIFLIGPAVSLFLGNDFFNNKIFLNIISYLGQNEILKDSSLLKLRLSILFLSVFILSQILNYYSLKKGLRLAFDIAEAVSNRLYKSIIRKDLNHIVNFNTNKIISILTEQTDRFVHGGLVFLIRISPKIFMLIFFSITFLIINTFLSLLILSIIFIYYYFFYFLIKKKLYSDGASIDKYSFEKIQLISETFNSYRDISIYNLKKILISELEVVNKVLKLAKHSNAISSIFSKYIIEVAFICAMLIFGMINLLYFGNSNNELIIYLIILVFAAYKIIPTFQEIFNTFSGLRIVKNAAQEISDQISNSKNKDANLLHYEINNQIIFQNLSLTNINFEYSNRKNIFKNFSILINKGDRICFSGNSGSGKSTLIDIILGLTKINHGELKLNREIINSHILNRYHNIIGFVPQKIFLFNKSIIENITLDFDIKKNINKRQLEFALEISTLDDFVKELPQGLDTKVGQFGGKLSGGQIQRISIARAVYRDPQIFIMDEPTSSLNETLSRKIILNISNLKNKTIIISSHKVHELSDLGYKIIKIN
jgi:ABC-type multidrug transport system fused ATPase/permease subunit